MKLAGPLHPAPIFNRAPVAIKEPPQTRLAAHAQRVQPAVPAAPARAAPSASMRTPGEIITDIQRALARRG